MRSLIHETLKQIGKEAITESPLTDFVLYKEARRQSPHNLTQAITLMLDPAIKELAETDATGAEIIDRHFFRGELIQTIASKLNLAEGTIYNRQSSAITQLAEIVEEQEHQAKADYACKLEGQLPPPSYENLLGIDEHVSMLSDLLTRPSSPWIVALVGIGGIGKTSLANHIVRTLIAEGRIHEVAWVTAKVQTMSPSGLTGHSAPALAAEELMRSLLAQIAPEQNLSGMDDGAIRHALCTHLQERPHLIVVDNLETVQDIDALIGTLESLSNPTKFLVTTRESMHDHVSTHNISMTELEREATLALIRQEANNRNLAHLQAASDQALMPLVETVGGNPLALRLVVGQTQVHPLDVVLENLRMARGKKAGDLYVYIYRQAWDALDEVARRTLLVMPLVSSVGADLAHIAKIAKLEMGEVIDALDQLVRLSLVDSSGDLTERRYTIHSLTRTFLHEQVLQWGV